MKDYACNTSGLVRKSLFLRLAQGEDTDVHQRIVLDKSVLRSRSCYHRIDLDLALGLALSIYHDCTSRSSEVEEEAVSFGSKMKERMESSS